MDSRLSWVIPVLLCNKIQLNAQDCPEQSTQHLLDCVYLPGHQDLGPCPTAPQTPLKSGWIEHVFLNTTRERKQAFILSPVSLMSQENRHAVCLGDLSREQEEGSPIFPEVLNLIIEMRWNLLGPLEQRHSEDKHQDYACKRNCAPLPEQPVPISPVQSLLTWKFDSDYGQMSLYHADSPGFCLALCLQMGLSQGKPSQWGFWRYLFAVSHNWPCSAYCFLELSPWRPSLGRRKSHPTRFSHQFRY